ncbi:MAG: hypothetical protein RL226_1457 [Bacteroidota bacterium]|jgi:mono/diheme cytochrome c family protein
MAKIEAYLRDKYNTDMKSQASVLFIVTVFLAACGGSESPTIDSFRSEIQIDDKLLQQGFTTLQTTCTSCHAWVEPKSTPLAPTFAEIRAAYLHTYGEKGFIHAVADYAVNPSDDRALLKESVSKFGIMPNPGLPRTDIEAAAAYLQSAQLTDASWESTVLPGEVSKYASNVPKDAGARGKELALQTKAVLGKNLLGAIKERGTVGAIDFCNTRAIQITDSMSLALGASIRRVSDKPRNQHNAASEQQRTILEQYKNALAAGEEPQPMVVSENGETYVYYPIETNEMCLQCHGSVGKEVKMETIKAIEKHYPADLATGYGVNQIRGMWEIKL